MRRIKLKKRQIRQAVEAANQAMDEAIAAGVESNSWLRQTFSADVVYAVWQDPSEPHNVGVGVLKGIALIENVRDTGQGAYALTAYVRCKCEEEAMAMSQVYGDDKAEAV